MKRLSSKITFLYKYILPLLNICIVIVCCIEVIIGINDIDKMMPFLIGLIFFLIIQIILLPLLKLRDVFYNEEITIIQDRKKKEVFKNYQIKRIKRHLFYFYIIEILNDELKRVLILPHISGVFLKLGFKPTSIKQYEKIIEQTYLESNTPKQNNAPNRKLLR